MRLLEFRISKFPGPPRPVHSTHILKYFPMPLVSIVNYILFKTWWSNSLEDSGQDLVGSIPYYILYNSWKGCN